MANHKDTFVHLVKAINLEWINGYLKVGFACAVLLALVTGCAPSNAATVNPIDPQIKPAASEAAPMQTPTKTITPELPTVTSTPTIEPSPTLEPTKTSNQLAEAAGLDVKERHYAIETRTEGTYLVDTYNKAPKAVKLEDGTWRKLDYHNSADAETMYSRMTPPDPDGTAPWNGYRMIGITIPDTLISPFFRLTFFPVYTGDWVQREAAGPDGQRLTLTYLVTTLRDDTGGLRVMELGAMAEAPGETFDLAWGCRGAVDQWKGEYFTTADALLDYLPPGQRLTAVDFPFTTAGRTPKVPDLQVEDRLPFTSWKTTNALPRLVPWLLPRSTDGQLTEAEAHLINQTGVLPDRVLVNNAFSYILGYDYGRKGSCP